MILKSSEHIAMITGANAGIGLALTKKLLAEKWQVIAVNRSDYPTDDISINQAIENGRLRIYKAKDLSDFASLKHTLQKIKEQEKQIDLLFNNAGGSFHELSYSKQGREMHYELMAVVPYIILMEMKGLLTNGRGKTVINTSSSAISFTKQLSIEMLEHPTTFRKLIGPYANAKLALSLWTQEIASELLTSGIKIRSVDPGGNNTLRKGKKTGLPFIVKPLMKLFFPPPTHGAKLLYEGAVGQHQHKTGVFLKKGHVTALKFQDKARLIADSIHTIYEREYVSNT